MPELNEKNRNHTNTKPVYISAGCNRVPNCLAWSKKVALYASCNSVVAAVDSEGTLEAVSTFCGHSGRVNCVRWLDGEDRCFATASADGTAAVWRRRRKSERVSFEKVRVLKGHTQAVTVSTGVKVSHENEEDKFLLAATGGDCTIRIWTTAVPEEDDAKEETEKQRIDLGRGLCMDLRVAQVGRRERVMLLAAMEDCKVHVFGGSSSGIGFTRRHVLRGHEDWVRCLDVSPVNAGGFLVASGGQDGFVRIWRMARGGMRGAKGESDGELTVQRETFDLAGQEEEEQDDSTTFTVTLETVLAGHEDKVFSVQWKESDSSLSLLTSSLDKTMIVWSPPEEKDSTEEEEQVWRETVRLGELGGNTLGFLGAQFDPRRGEGILGYSFSGAFHSWEKEGDRWRSGVQLGGHSDQVKDIDWGETGDRQTYLMSVSTDQTTRVHSLWKRKTGVPSLWREVARPQVHGHDLSCLCVLPGGARMASGAEEKVVRVFEATRSFVENLGTITGIESGEKSKLMAQGASVPSLGLSNKAVMEGQPSAEEEKERHVKDQFPDHYFKTEAYDEPPPEEALAQNTLWPELQKLYGHGYEVFSLAADPTSSSGLLASACKASKADHAEVILWEEEEVKEGQPPSWRARRQRLRAHNLTVTQMEFSPCGRFLLTVSRDRTWALFEKNDDSGDFAKVAFTDKTNAGHQRLIWACSWASDSRHFATVSRDKKLAVWGREKEGDDDGAKTSLGIYGMSSKKPMLLSDSVTAVSIAPAGNEQEKGTYLMAAGLESGHIVLLEWREDKEEEDEWRILEELDSDAAHHKTVKRLRFRRAQDQHLLLASCGEDHSVKIFSLSQ